MESGRMVMVTGSQPCPALGGLAIHSVSWVHVVQSLGVGSGENWMDSRDSEEVR